MKMKSLALALLVAAAPLAANAQVAGSAVLGVAVEEARLVANGWSAKKKILGADIYNDKGDKVGAIDDIIISPDPVKAVSYVIVKTGGFLGIDKHDVAIPVGQFQLKDNKLVLPGATKDALKALPEFEYAK